MTLDPIFSTDKCPVGNYYYLCLYERGYNDGDSVISQKIGIPFSVYREHMINKYGALPYEAMPSNVIHQLTFCTKEDADKALEWVKSCYMTIVMNNKN